MKKFILALFLLFLVSLPAWSQTPEAAFYEANRLYAEGEYEQAAGQYKQLLQSGIKSAPLFYNLGNALTKLGEYGQAALAYRRALKLTPRDAELRYNLRLVESRLKDQILPQAKNPLLSSYWRFVNRLTENEWLALFLASVLFLFIIAVLRLYWVPARKIWGRIFIGFSLISFIVFLFLIGKAVEAGKVEAVVTAKEVQARYGPSETDVPAFTLHEGAPCEIISPGAEWVQIRLADGKVAWLPAGALETI